MSGGGRMTQMAWKGVERGGDGQPVWSGASATAGATAELQGGAQAEHAQVRQADAGASA